MIPNKVAPNIYEFIPRVNYRVFDEVYGASVVAFYRDNSKIKSVITKLLFNLDKMHAITTHNNVLCLGFG